MGTQSIGIFGRIANWCGSVTGILTILIVATTANRMILTAIREKHGKESTFYRNSKLISGTLYLIFFVNCLSSIFRWLLGIGTQAKMQVGDKIAVNTASTTQMWISVAILVIIYIVMMTRADKRCKISSALIATTVLTAGIQIVCKKFWLTAIVALFGLVILCAFVDCVGEPEEKEHKITKKGVFLVITWAASVIAAYMAGEYSLVPKAIEYVQSHFKKGTKPTDEEPSTSESKKETVPVGETTTE